jgi:hypothetical protein
MAASNVLDISPETLSFSTESGDFVDSGVTIRNLDTNPRDLSISYIRVKESGDFSTLQPKNLNISRAPATIQARDIIDIPITLNTIGMEHGEYRGTLLVLSNTTEISVPVILKIKVPVYIPAGILFISALISVLVFNWSFAWQKKTLLKRQISVTRAKVEGDTLLSTNEYARFFRQKITSALDDASGKLLAGDYTDADEARKKAEKYWDKWNSHLPDGTEFFDESQEIKKSAEDLELKFTDFKGKYPLFDEIIDAITQFWIKTANAEPDAAIDFTPINELDSTLIKLNTLLEDMQKTKSYCMAGGDKQKECCVKFSAVLRKLQNVKYKDLNVADLQNDLAAIIEIPSPTKRLPLTRGDTVYSIAGLPMQAPLQGKVLKHKMLQETEILSKKILIVEFLIGTVLPIFILTVIGLVLLYYKNPTFGSEADYITLFFWGVMSCVTKDGIWEKISPLFSVKTNT